jgi:hypothetical protein
MNLKEAFGRIDSPEFALRMNAASTLPVFTDAVRSEAAVEEVEARLRSKTLDPGVLVDRIKALQSIATDIRYENPRDVAFAVYLWVLSRTAPDIALIAAETILSIPQIWWSRQLAGQTLRDKRNESAGSTLAPITYHVAVVGNAATLPIELSTFPFSVEQHSNVFVVYVAFHAGTSFSGIQRNVSVVALSAISSQGRIISRLATTGATGTGALNTANQVNNKIDWDK